MSDMPHRVRLNPDHDGFNDPIIGWADGLDLDPDEIMWPVYIREDIARADTAAAVTAAPQCCMCGKKNLSTVEGDGGSECQLDDDRWVCSSECYSTAIGETQAAAVTAALEGAAGKVSSFRANLNFEAMLALLRDNPLPEPIVQAVSKLLNGVSDSIRATIPAEGRAALDAMIAAAVEQGFRAHIIPLDWKEVRSLGVGQREFSASTILGEYSVSAGGWANGKTAVSMPTRSETLWLDGGIEDGQRAARDDYEAHILSAIRDGAPK